MTNLRSSSKCDLCQAEHESIYHIQQDCPELADARTKAHNDIWAEVWEVIKVTASKSRWSTYYETPIKDTGLKYSQALPAATIANRRPDGIMMKQLDESSKRHVILFDFTRCHGHDLVSLMEASNRKNAGYQELTEHLQQHNPKDVIVFVPLAMSYDCSLDVSFWTSAFQQAPLNFTGPQIATILRRAIIAGIVAFSSVIDARSAHPKFRRGEQLQDPLNTGREDPSQGGHDPTVE